MMNEIDAVEKFLWSNTEMSDARRSELSSMLAKIKNPRIPISEKLFLWEKILADPGILETLKSIGL